MTSEQAVSRDDIVTALDEVWAQVADLCRPLTEAEWKLPSRLPGWSVQDLVAHMFGTEAMLAGRPHPSVDVGDADHLRNDIGRFNEAWISERRDRPGAEVLAEFIAVTSERRDLLGRMDQAQFDEEAWTPAGKSTYGRFMQIRVFDCWMHEQDIRAAIGRPGHLSGVAPRVAMTEVAGALGYVVGKKAGAPRGSSVAIVISGPERYRFDVVVAERARVVTTPTLAPTATVSTDLATFLALIGGRTDADAALANGMVELSGDRGLGSAVAQNLAFVI